MYIKIRRIGCTSTEDMTISTTKNAAVKSLRNEVLKVTGIQPQDQLLLYKGKQLNDDNTLLDYGVQLNDVIQLLVRTTKELTCHNILPSESDVDIEKPELIATKSKVFKINDCVDVRGLNGAWTEAEIDAILAEQGGSKKEADLIYKCRQQAQRGGGEYTVAEFGADEVRARSFVKLADENLKRNQIVLVNYNVDDPFDVLGQWYDFRITKVEPHNLRATLLLPGENVKGLVLNLPRDVYRIEKTVARNIDYGSIPRRQVSVDCTKCMDHFDTPCKECGCKHCGGKSDTDKMLLCDECNDGYHIRCLNSPLEQMPPVDDDWYCPKCKTNTDEIVKFDQKINISKKRAKLPSVVNTSRKRDWGKGMACVGHRKHCTIVPTLHVGPIPGVEVGMCWKYRFQVGEAGVHRPIVAGIHGSEAGVAVSLVLSGGYEDDVDRGDEFLYTGAGGRDLTGNKRHAKQQCDQRMERMNRALANNCHAQFDKVNGAEAVGDSWRLGSPVRVVRNYRGAKHSSYAPQEGNRYDGIYKVVKYFPHRGLSGFLVWRYLLRRDDTAPAPWEPNAKHFDIVYPDGYSQAQANKRPPVTDNSTNDVTSAAKKPKLDLPATKYTPTPDMQNLIDSDEVNQRLWSECVTSSTSLPNFLSNVENAFMCVCCQELVYRPVTLGCAHNFCKACMKRSFDAQIFSCPCCRCDVGARRELLVNEQLANVLERLFAGYQATRAG